MSLRRATGGNSWPGDFIIHKGCGYQGFKVVGALCIDMKEEDEGFYPTRETFPTTCDNCGVPIKTEPFKGKGVSSEDQPFGHKDPRHSFGAYCSVECRKEDGGSGTIYGEK